jgi:hypothetical protein
MELLKNIFKRGASKNKPRVYQIVFITKRT